MTNEEIISELIYFFVIAVIFLIVILLVLEFFVRNLNLMIRMLRYMVYY